MKKQHTGSAENNYAFLGGWLEKYADSAVMLVCGRSFDGLRIASALRELAEEHRVEIVRFSGFSPNPDYSSAVRGAELFGERDCRAIIAVGGGSAVDTAKCIKLFSRMDRTRNYLEQETVGNDTELFAVPTTVGTGSEATSFAVVYFNGEKQSVAHDSALPDYVLFDPSAVSSLPDIHRGASMLDAMCHAVESYWSVNSTDESMAYSDEAIRLICRYWDSCSANEPQGNEMMQRAAFIAGKAINIAKTTAGHAMCYKLTSLYGLPHGIAAAVCTEELWLYMLKNTDKCIDIRGPGHMSEVFGRISAAFGCSGSYETVKRFSRLTDRVFGGTGFETGDIPALTESVNAERLKKNPVRLDSRAISDIYTNIFRARGEKHEG